MTTVDEWLLDRELDTQIIPDRSEFAILSEWLRAARRTPPVLFVGAGLSLNARPAPGVSGRARMQGWDELAKGLANALGGGSAGVDALQIAERYDKTFGRKALWDRIREAVPDSKVSPAEVHKAIADTQWHLILTVNYDTLLERAYEAVGIRPFVLTGEGHWAALNEHEHRARVAHLHGHIDGKPEDLVLTQEDFRRFPERRAVTRTVVRQLLLQHPTLFLGISADDPNLVEWAGWIRDHVGTVKAPWLRLDPVVRKQSGYRGRDLGFDAMWRESFQTVAVACSSPAEIDMALAQVVRCVTSQRKTGVERIEEYLSKKAHEVAMKSAPRDARGTAPTPKKGNVSSTPKTPTPRKKRR